MKKHLLTLLMASLLAGCMPAAKKGSSSSPSGQGPAQESSVSVPDLSPKIDALKKELDMDNVTADYEITVKSGETTTLSQQMTYAFDNNKGALTQKIEDIVMLSYLEISGGKTYVYSENEGKWSKSEYPGTISKLSVYGIITASIKFDSIIEQFQSVQAVDKTYKLEDVECDVDVAAIVKAGPYADYTCTQTELKLPFKSVVAKFDNNHLVSLDYVCSTYGYAVDHEEHTVSLEANPYSTQEIRYSNFREIGSTSVTLPSIES